jgi:hypothetical protein
MKAGIRIGLVLALLAPAARAAVPPPSAFALVPRPVPVREPALRPHAAEDLLAQRAIDREWGVSDDSTYRQVDVPGWKSEGLSLALSGVVPGAGQLYTGETSGWIYLLAEAAGWVERWDARRTADRRYDDVVHYLGDPSDTSSNFSFVRLRQNTGLDTATLEQLWAGDRDAYYRSLQQNAQYLPGFGGRPADTFNHFDDLMGQHDGSLRRATLMEMLLWLNHVGSAVDALRAARFHNVPLRQQYQLELGQRMRHGHPELRAAVVRRF